MLLCHPASESLAANARPYMLRHRPLHKPLPAESHKTTKLHTTGQRIEAELLIAPRALKLKLQEVDSNVACMDQKIHQAIALVG